MASIVLGVIGAVVAPLVGLPPQVGYALGSALGAALFPPPGHNGPRIADLKVQSSQFGTPIPLAYGSVRIAGVLIWADKLVEHPDQTDSGSGGGGTTNYTYTCSFAMSLCEKDNLSPKALGRIWADGKLIYEGRALPTKIGFIAGSYKFYDGAETQMPDPTMEALLGVGNVPAYRGQVYFVFTDLELGKYGNRLPNLTFELLAGTLANSTASELTYVDPLNVDDMTVIPDAQELWVSKDQDYLIAGDTRIFTRVDWTTMQFKGYVEVNPRINVYTYSAYDPQQKALWCYQGNAIGGNKLIKINALTRATLLTLTRGDNQGIYISPHDYSLWMKHTGSGYAPIFEKIDKDTGGTLGNYNYNDNILYNLLFDNSGNMWPIFYFGAQMNCLVKFTPTTGTFEVMYTAPRAIGNAVYDSKRNSLWFWTFEFGATVPNPDYPRHIMEYSITANALTGREIITPIEAGFSSYLTYDADRDWLWTTHERNAYLISTDLTTLTITHSLPMEYASSQMQFDPAAQAVFFMRGSTPVRLTFGTVATHVDVKLSEIVTDISVRAGLHTTNIDVSSLTDIVPGYTVPSRMTARTAIQPLSDAYFFDSVESGQQVKFIKRGGASALSIAVDQTVHSGKG